MSRKKFNKIGVQKITYKRNKKSLWEQQNDDEFYNQYMLLKMLSLSVFEWTNLPSSIDKLYFERKLFEMGKIVVFREEDFQVDDNSGILGLPVQLSHELNVYGIPKYRRAIASNGYSKELSAKESVIVYDNVLRMSLDNVIYSYAKRIANVERIIDVNLNHTRHPYAIVTTEKQKHEMERIFMDINNNKPFILVDEELKDMLTNKSEVLNLSAPFVVDKLMDYKNTLRNEVLTIIGIGNSSQDKRERLLASEMDNVSELNDAYLTIRLKARKQALEELKKMFPEFKDVEVRISTDLYLSEEFKESVGGENVNENNDSAESG